MSIHFFQWADGGGEYAAVIQDTAGGVNITMISEEVDTRRAQPIAATPAQVRWVATEWPLADGYAACYYSEVADDIGPIPDLADWPDAYLIVCNGRMFIIPEL